MSEVKKSSLSVVSCCSRGLILPRDSLKYMWRFGTPAAPHPNPLPEGEGGQGANEVTVSLHMCRFKRPAPRGGNCDTIPAIAARPVDMPGGSAHANLCV